MSKFTKKLKKELNEKEYKYISDLGKGTFGIIEKWLFQDNIYAIKQISGKENIERNVKVINYVNKYIKNFDYILFYQIKKYNNNYYFISDVISYDFFDYFIYYNNLPNLKQLYNIIYQLFLGINY